mgnify:CR=1 FL=1
MQDCLVPIFEYVWCVYMYVVERRERGRREREEREIFVETGGIYGPWPSAKKHNVFCVRSQQKKLIYNDTPETWEFYKISEDPNEMNNIYDEKLEDVKKFKKKMMFYFNENKINTKLTPKF